MWHHYRIGIALAKMKFGWRAEAPAWAGEQTLFAGVRRHSESWRLSRSNGAEHRISGHAPRHICAMTLASLIRWPAADNVGCLRVRSARPSSQVASMASGVASVAFANRVELPFMMTVMDLKGKEAW